MADLKLNSDLTNVFTKPTSDPLPILLPRDTKDTGDAWQDAGNCTRYAADAMMTAALRLTTPFVISYGLAHHNAQKGGAVGLLKAAGALPVGFVAGACIGGAGIVCNLFEAGFGLAGGAWNAGQSGLNAWKTPKEQEKATPGAAK